MSSRFAGRAVGAASLAGRDPDLAVVREALAILADPAHAIELRCAPSWQSWVFDGTDLDGMCRAVKGMAGSKGIYYSLNPVRKGCDKATVESIVCRRWFLIDADSVRTEKDSNATDSNATDEEKEAAHQLALRVREYLTSLGWPEPILIDSGNGWHLLYRLDLPNDRLSQAMLRTLLNVLKARFDTAAAFVDGKVHNAGRISKLPGTWACKGPHSEARPHRLARLVSVPATIAVVPASLLSPPGHDGAVLESPRASGFSGRATGPKNDYAKKALQLETAAVVLAPEGDRNNKLNEAAFALGQLVAGGALVENEVAEQLAYAGRRAGLGEDEIASTIRSGLEAGKKQPRTPPEPIASQQAASKPTMPEGEPLTVGLSEITPRKVEWLIHNRLAKRFITVFAGRTGIGKSFVACDIIARLSRGGEIPLSNGECFEKGSSLIISEDSHEYVLAPRLLGLGADLSRVRAMTWKAMSCYHLGDVAMLERAAKEVGDPRLLIIDPPTNFLGDVDEHKNSEVRQTVMKVVEWVFGRDMACLFILHVNKQTGKGIDALNRVLGSVAWVTTSRIAHSFCADPDDKTRSLFVPIKNNLGPLPKALAYQVVSNDGAATVEWKEEVDISADDAMAGEPSKPRKVVASEWLVERFRERLEWESEDLFKRAKAVGISRSAMFEAKKALDLPRARRVGLESGDVEYYWWVHADWSLLQIDPPQRKGGIPKLSDECAF